MMLEDQRNLGYFINLNLLNIQKAALREEEPEKVCQLIFNFVGDNMAHCEEGETKEELMKAIDGIKDHSELNIREIMKWQKLKFKLLGDKNIMNHRARAFMTPEDLL